MKRAEWLDLPAAPGLDVGLADRPERAKLVL